MKAARPEPEIVTRKGKPVSVILPIKDDEELLERVEEAEDTFRNCSRISYWLMRQFAPAEH